PASIATWALASKLAVELVSREHAIPTIVRRQGRFEARWAAALSSSEDAARVALLARSMPPAAHPGPVAPGDALEVWAPDALLRTFLDAAVDALVRNVRGAPELPAAKKTKATRAPATNAAWDARFRTALEGPDRSFETQGFAERSVVDSVERW